MSDVIRIGGRDFEGIERSTLEHDAYCMRELRLAGLDAVALRPGESAELFGARLLYDVVSSGRLFELLGGLVVPLGMQAEAWTPAVAEDTATFLKRLIDPAEKEKAQRLILNILLPFFIDALGSSGASSASSAESEPPSSSSGGESSTASGPGEPSSGSSPITTMTKAPG